MSPAAPPPALVLLAGLLLALVPGPAAHAQTVWHADADATGADTGLSWADAFTDLQDALAVAEPGDEVWVAEGVYKPTDTDDRTATFTLAFGVALYGGFDGTETARDERDWAAHEAVLSGDVGVPGDSLDNSFNVVSAPGTDPTTALDGFTVQHGKASVSTPPYDRGAGLFAPDSDIRVRNTTFRWNVASVAGGAQAGGGIYFEGGAPLVEDCVFEWNVGGGAVYDAGGAPTLRRVTIREHCCSGLKFEDGSAGLVEDAVLEDNPSTALLIRESSPRLVRVTVRDNHAPTSDVGAAYVSGTTATPAFEDCLFENNTAREAAALLLDGGASALFLRTTFRDNRASVTGGAVVAKLATPVFLGCRFERNRAPNAGAINALNSGVVLLGSTLVGNVTSREDRSGAVVVTGNPWQGRPVLMASTVFAGNEGGSGGAIGAFFVGEGEGRVVNVTFAGNRARAGGGGAVYADDAGGLRIENGVLWGNEGSGVPGGGEVFAAEGEGPIVAQSLVMGGCPAGATCTDVLDADPRFVRPPSPGPDDRWGTADDDYGDLRLVEGSPGLDYGLEAYLPPDVWDLDGDGDTEEPLPLDAAGSARVLGASVDAGAYEGAFPVAAEPGPEVAALRLSVWPNPSRGAAEIALVLPEAGAVEVSLYDVLGRRVAVLHEGPMAAGRHDMVLDASTLTPGVYIVRASNEGAFTAHTVTLLR